MSFDLTPEMIEEHIADDVDRMIHHGWYSSYGFKSVGQVLAFIYGYTNQLRIAESVIVGDGKVFLYNEILATYYYDEQRQIPVFEFVKSYNACNKRQEAYLKFLQKQDMENFAVNSKGRN